MMTNNNATSTIYGNNYHNDLQDDDIRDYIPFLEKAQGLDKYICPVCDGNDLSINQDGKFTCYSNECDRTEIYIAAKKLAGEYTETHHNRALPKPRTKGKTKQAKSSLLESKHQPVPISKDSVLLAQLPSILIDIPTAVKPDGIPDRLEDKLNKLNALDTVEKIRYWYSENVWLDRYQYRDESKEKSREKDFIWGYRNPQTGEIKRQRIESVYPYRFSEVLDYASGKSFLAVEGEKSVEARRSIGLVATDTSQLIKSPQCLDSMKEKDITVVIIPDKDKAGINKAKKLEQSCLKHRVKYLILDVYQWLKDKPDKYDIADIVSEPNMNAEKIIEVLNRQIKQALENRTNDIPFHVDISDGQVQSQFITEEREIVKEKVDSLLAHKNNEPDISTYLPSTLAKPLEKLASYLGMRPVSLLTILLPISASLLFNDVNKLILIEASEFEALPLIYTAICAPSGSGKSPAYKALMKPLLQMQSEEDERYQLALEKWKQLLEEERQEQEQPTIREYFVNDATTEAIATIQGNQPDKGLLGYFDELAQLFKQNGQYKNGRGSDVEKLLRSRDGTGIKVNRVHSEKRISCLRSGYSLTGGIQPLVLQKMMGNFEDPNGLWARFVFVCQPMQKKLYPEESQSLGLTLMLKKLYQFLSTIKQEFRFNPQAQQCYRSWYELVEKKKIDEPKPALQSVWSKSQRLVGEIALILHCLKYGVDERQPPKEVGIDILEAAIDLAKFYIGQITLIHADEDSERGDIDASLTNIVDLSSRKGWIKAKDVKSYLRSFKSIHPDTIRSHFKELETMGYGSTRGNGNQLEWSIEKGNNGRQTIDEVSTAKTIT